MVLFSFSTFFQPFVTVHALSRAWTVTCENPIPNRYAMRFSIDSGINPTDDYDNTNHSRPQVVLFSFSTFFQPFSKSFSGPFLTLLLLFQLPFLFPVPLCGLPGALLLLILQTGPWPWPDPLHRQPRTTCSREPPQCGRHIRAGRADFPAPSHSNSALPCSLHTT